MVGGWQGGRVRAGAFGEAAGACGQIWCCLNSIAAPQRFFYGPVRNRTQLCNMVQHDACCGCGRPGRTGRCSIQECRI